MVWLAYVGLWLFAFAALYFVGVLLDVDSQCGWFGVCSGFGQVWGAYR